jgi:prepilin-type N-terminal cleavage/methylation domain-containing protein
MEYKNKQGFTLVELIVVITILAILWTIAFVSLQWYSLSARESSRISDVRTVEKKLAYFKLENSYYPLPDNSINITASGAVIWQQWVMGSWALTTIKQAGEVVDPLDWDNYSYYVLSDKSSYQLIALMESSSTAHTPSLSPYAFADFSDRYPKLFWNKLWLVTDINNTPVNTLSWATDIDIVQTTDTYIAHVDNTVKYEWVGDDIRYSVPRSSCQRLSDLNLAGTDGYYTIYPIDEIPTEVYCRFVDWNWYTLISRSIDDIAFNNTHFGWFVSTGSPKIDTAPYSLGQLIQDIPFKEIYIEVAWNWKERSTVPGLDWVTVLEVTDIDLFTPANLTNPLPVNNCTWWWCALFSNWWNFWSRESYFLSPTTTNINWIWDLSDLSLYSWNQRDWLNARRYGATFPYPWMIFVK